MCAAIVLDVTLKTADATQTDATIQEEDVGRSRYTDAQRAAAIELRRAGHKAEAVAVTLGIPVSTVYSMCRAAGLKSHMGRPQACNRHDHEKIAELRKKGLSTRKIAEQVGCSHSTVGNVLREMGLGKVSKPTKGGEFAPELVARVVRRYAEGANLDDLGVEETMRKQKIKRILRSAGVQIRGGGGGDRRFVGRATMRWRLIWNEDDDEQWAHLETGVTCTLTDRGLEACEKRFIVLEPELAGHFATRDDALEAVEARKP
jgi:hypothetical protein